MEGGSLKSQIFEWADFKPRLKIRPFEESSKLTHSHLGFVVWWNISIHNQRSQTSASKVSSLHGSKIWRLIAIIAKIAVPSTMSKIALSLPNPTATVSTITVAATKATMTIEVSTMIEVGTVMKTSPQPPRFPEPLWPLRGSTSHLLLRNVFLCFTAVIYFLFVMIGVEPRATHVLGKHSTSELHP